MFSFTIEINAAKFKPMQLTLTNTSNLLKQLQYIPLGAKTIHNNYFIIIKLQEMDTGITFIDIEKVTCKNSLKWLIIIFFFDGNFGNKKKQWVFKCANTFPIPYVYRVETGNENVWATESNVAIKL
jgi:hypothetical protein